jgi:thiamine biosynthesis lipoprotein
VSILEKQKVPHYCINAGGDIYAKKGNGFKPWTIYLEHPDKPDFAIGKLELHKNAIAASSSNKRFWKNQKGVFHHIINPKTKKPSSGLKEVFVLAKKAIDADAYATAFFAAGFFQAIALSFVLPVEVLLISDQNKIYKSKNFRVELF